MPFTANRDFKADPRLVVRAEGVHYWNHRGERILDGSSGLFCSAAGHGRPEIAEAVAKQLLEMDFAAPFQMGHPAAFEVARRVAALTPGDLNHVFFVNSGSEAVDTALKIALAYASARGEGRRQRFVSRERAYHGVNVGGTSLSGIMKNREAFGALMPGVVHMRHTWLPENRFTKGQPAKGAELAEDLQRIAELVGGNTIAACFIEPIAGSTGILVPPKGYLERLREICDAHGILLVFDEVICGFGRTGKAFAAQSFGVTPDMITMAKALTNAAQPMGAVAIRDDIYDTVVDAAPGQSVELFHGYTYSAHPAACAAALATLDIYERENLFERAAEMSPYFLDSIFALEDMPGVTDIRGYGMIAGIDIAPGPVPGMRGYEATKRLFRAGLHVKFTGDCALVAPPLIAGKSDIDEICAILREVLGGMED
ncbi:MAG: aminotransferase class III-fold pyridoxal phosphate-dependent enzyme [Alphaproteobacteria bacterium]|nr:aminotransferase class III-fold pyridoxal phosphate-dependent enzyme [Alphaproteobacteria bacterium]